MSTMRAVQVVGYHQDLQMTEVPVPVPEGAFDVVVKIGGQTKRAHADKNGRFAVDWKAPGTGNFDVRAQAKSNRDASGSKDSGGSITAYRWAEASWYGPGLYGNRTGCGGRLGYSQVGVAHKTLPCGTRVTLRHRGRSLRVRVIDRGPYVGAREYDLTEATARKLRFSGHGGILTTR